MDGVTIAVAAALVAAVSVVFALIWRQRRSRTEQRMKELLDGYFKEEIPADRLGRRAREIASRQFLGSAAFQALAVAAFQSAADAKLAQPGYSRKDEENLLRLSAALTREFGLPDRYRSEGWRAGRE